MWIKFWTWIYIELLLSKCFSDWIFYYSNSTLSIFATIKQLSITIMEAEFNLKLT